MSGKAVEKKLTLPEIAKRTGAKYRTLQFWLERGLIKPSLYESQGTGRPSLFNERDAEVVAGLVRLRDNGLTMDALALVAAEWNRAPVATCPVCKADIELGNQPASLREGREPGLAHRREQAVNDLLALALIADDEEMKADLERLAARFSFPPYSKQKGPS